MPPTDLSADLRKIDPVVISSPQWLGLPSDVEAVTYFTLAGVTPEQIADGEKLPPGTGAPARGRLHELARCSETAANAAKVLALLDTACLTLGDMARRGRYIDDLRAAYAAEVERILRAAGRGSTDHLPPADRSRLLGIRSRFSLTEKQAEGALRGLNATLREWPDDPVYPTAFDRLGIAENATINEILAAEKAAEAGLDRERRAIPGNQPGQRQELEERVQRIKSNAELLRYTSERTAYLRRLSAERKERLVAYLRRCTLGTPPLLTPDDEREALRYAARLRMNETAARTVFVELGVWSPPPPPPPPPTTPVKLAAPLHVDIGDTDRRIEFEIPLTNYGSAAVRVEATTEEDAILLVGASVLVPAGGVAYVRGGVKADTLAEGVNEFPVRIIAAGAPLLRLRVGPAGTFASLVLAGGLIAAIAVSVAAAGAAWHGPWLWRYGTATLLWGAVPVALVAATRVKAGWTPSWETLLPLSVLSAAGLFVAHPLEGFWGGAAQLAAAMGLSAAAWRFVGEVFSGAPELSRERRLWVAAPIGAGAGYELLTGLIEFIPWQWLGVITAMFVNAAVGASVGRGLVAAADRLPVLLPGLFPRSVSHAQRTRWEWYSDPQAMLAAAGFVLPVVLWCSSVPQSGRVFHALFVAAAAALAARDALSHSLTRVSKRQARAIGAAGLAVALSAALIGLTR